MSNFRERLNCLLDEHDMTPAEAAKFAGISKTTISHWSRFDILPEAANLIKIAQYFKCPIDYFLGKTNKTEMNFSKNPVHFADRLDILVREKGITPYRASKQLHIGNGLFGDWLNKKKMPSFDSILLLTDYFNCSADYLLGVSDER